MTDIYIGKITEDNCIQCPFHHWKYDKEGNVAEIPYNKDPKCVPKFGKLRTYKCVEYIGWICVYFHADNKDPEYELPEFLAKEAKDCGFVQHMKWDVGFHTCSVIDLVDQMADHAHFNILHGEFLIPWTQFPLPKWLKKILPIGIHHELTTFLGDDKEWKSEVEQTGWGSVDKYLAFFYDVAGITWDGKLIPTTISPTTEMYIGPSLVIFNIPFKIGEQI
jgi:phenylpropionate dioxygenase-like ring-hydroxylating dioxygenase large terminal subunit